MLITKLSACLPDGHEIGRWLFASEQEAEQATAKLAKMLKLDIAADLTTVEIPSIAQPTGAEGVTVIRLEVADGPPKPQTPPQPNPADFPVNYSRN